MEFAPLPTFLEVFYKKLKKKLMMLRACKKGDLNRSLFIVKKERIFFFTIILIR